jgi:alpha-glucosidase
MAGHERSSHWLQPHRGNVLSNMVKRRMSAITISTRISWRWPAGGLRAGRSRRPAVSVDPQRVRRHQRHSAVWTGDNASNWRHLRMSLPCSLNLGLSGVAFNGPDVGGFMDDVSANCWCAGIRPAACSRSSATTLAHFTRRQEPWQFGPGTAGGHSGRDPHPLPAVAVSVSVLLRALADGDPIIRPLLYHYPEPEFSDLDDQYLVGDALLVAPILHGEGQGLESIQRGVKYQERRIALPAGWWFDLNHGVWVQGGRVLHYAAAADELPLFARDGAVLPYYAGPLRNSFMDLSAIDLHLFCHDQPAQLEYTLDDRETRRYEQGTWGLAQVTAEVREERATVKIAESGDYPRETVRFTPVVYGRPEVRELELTVNGQTEERKLQTGQREWLCRNLMVQA